MAFLLATNKGTGLFYGEQPESSEYFLESVEEDFGIIDASEVCSEELDLGIERFGVSVGASVVEECQYALDVIINGVAGNLKMLYRSFMCAVHPIT